MAVQMDINAVDNLMKTLLEKDLRIQCRARGLSPAGSRDTLRERLKENMMETNDFRLRDDNGQIKESNAPLLAGASAESETMRNNFARPGGQQNVGNFLTGRNSSRVLQAPGGTSNITFG